MATAAQRQPEFKFPMGRPKFMHPWETIPVGWRGTVRQLSKRLKISTKAVYMMITGDKGCSLPRGFRATREGSRYYIERTEDVPFRDLVAA